MQHELKKKKNHTGLHIEHTLCFFSALGSSLVPSWHMISKDSFPTTPEKQTLCLIELRSVPKPLVGKVTCDFLNSRIDDLVHCGKQACMLYVEALMF